MHRSRTSHSLDQPASRRPSYWGNWEYRPQQVAIVYTGSSVGRGYPIPLEGTGTAAQVLDYIVQAHRQPWIKEDDIHGLVTALDDLLGLQANLCPSGTSAEIDDMHDLLRGRGYEAETVKLDGGV